MDEGNTPVCGGMAVNVLQMIDVGTGDVLDTIRLVEGRIVAETGPGSHFFAGKRTAVPGTSDEQLLAAYANWSDGQIALHPVTGAAPAV
ncbi:hypothetical protein [Cryptosporangium sp. NPDC048952]|uniref:hypothetical protein n=1 Tax=Cryptosporangium sp. NPDC048952 TaxID=3363961 RepID=UPI00371AF2E6